MYTEKASLHKLFWNADYVKIIVVKKIIYFKISELADLVLFSSYIRKQVPKLNWFLISERTNHWTETVEHNEQKKSIFLDSAEQDTTIKIYVGT